MIDIFNLAEIRAIKTEYRMKNRIGHEQNKDHKKGQKQPKNLTQSREGPKQ